MKNIDIEQKIKGMSLTKTEKIIADYIIEHKHTIGLATVTELALAIGVSDTSIIRLLRALGYDGYADFKRDMGSRMMQEYSENRVDMTVGEKFLKSRDVLAKNDVVNEVVTKALTNIRNTFATLDQAVLQDIAAVLLKSKRKHIVGFRGATSCVNYMARKMALILPNVTAFDRAESIVLENIIDITKNDCLLMYSFSRYSEINLPIIKKAKEKGAKIILITDRITSPLATYADYVLTSAVEGAGITVSYIVPMCISEALLLLISKNLSAKDKERLAELDAFVSNTSQY